MAESRPQWMNIFNRRRKRDQTSPTNDRKNSIPKDYMKVDRSYTLSQTQIEEFGRLKDDLQSQYHALRDSRAEFRKGRNYKQTNLTGKLNQKRSGNGSLRLSRKSQTWPAGIGVEHEQVRDAENNFMQAVDSLASFMEAFKAELQRSPRMETIETFTETTQAKTSDGIEEHPLLAKYYETAGLVKLIYQELIDEDWQYHDEKVRRNLLIDQEKPLSIADSDFESTHSNKRKQLEERLDNTLAEADNLRDACINNGLRIEMPEEAEQFDTQPDATVDTFEVHHEISQSEATSPDAGEVDIDAALATSQARLTSISHNDLRINSWMQTMDPKDQETEQKEVKEAQNSNHVTPVSVVSEEGVT